MTYEERKKVYNRFLETIGVTTSIEISTDSVKDLLYEIEKINENLSSHGFIEMKKNLTIEIARTLVCMELMGELFSIEIDDLCNRMDKEMEYFDSF